MDCELFRYPRLLVSSDNVYADRLFDRRDLKEYVPFTQNINTPIHRWFYFEHGFSSKLIDILLSEMNATDENVFYDPFCGVGTAPVTSIMKGIPSIGSDISPFCVFVTNTKLASLNITNNEELLKAIIQFNRNLDSQPSDSVYEWNIISKLFSEKVFLEILSIRNAIDEVEGEISRDLCKLALLSIIEKVGQKTRTGMTLERDSIRPRQLFMSKLEQIAEDLLHTQAARSEAELLNAKAIVGDAREIKLDQKIDIVITSPPYLDFYDYMHMYEPEHALYFVSSPEELLEIRHRTIRSHSEARYNKSSAYKSDILAEALEAIVANERGKETIAYNYFEDMWFVFKNLSRNIIQNALVLFIVENKEYSGVTLEVDTLLAEIAIDNGFNLEGILVTKQRKNNRRDSIVVVSKK